MLTAKDILTKNGQPVLVTVDSVADNKRFPATQFGFEIELPDAVKEQMREQIREHAHEQALKVGRAMGMSDEDIEADIAEVFAERLDDAPISCLADEPFAICWN